MSQINEHGFEIGKCWECLTELEVKRLSHTEDGHYLCPGCVREHHSEYSIIKYANEIDEETLED